MVEKKQIDGHDSLVAKYDPNALSGLEKKKKGTVIQFMSNFDLTLAQKYKDGSGSAM